MLFGELIASWKGFLEFRKLAAEKRQIVFYSEGASYHKFLWPVMERLTTDFHLDICYVTSDKHDPLLTSNSNQIKTFYISARTALITFFEAVDADILVLSTPDLGNMHVRRSQRPVHYAYIHHSMVSSHMIYRTGAFDNFDSILCVGPHQIEETRQWEKEYRLKPKQLFEHGYAPLDDILANKPDNYTPPVSPTDTKVIIAPSWGPQGLLETVGEQVVENLMKAGYKVIVRPHPRTRQFNPKKINSIAKRFGNSTAFSMEESITGFAGYLASDILISDWSGAALEFAFGLERPVLFIDLPPKVNNPEYERIKATPLEIFIRNKIGVVIDPNSLEKISEFVENAVKNYSSFIPSIREARAEWIFNVGNSTEKGAQIIFDLHRNMSKSSIL